MSRLQRFFVSNQSAATLVNLWPRQPENRAAAFCFEDNKMNVMTESDKIRFWQKVDKSGDCWEWLACKVRGGYGQFWLNDRHVYSHRISWTMHFGEIPNKMEVCHKCDNPGCVNPSHLFLGTHSDNMNDAYDKGRRIFKGERNSYSKLTKDDVLLIRDMRKNEKFKYGDKKKFCVYWANKYNVDWTTILNVINNKQWKHLLEA